jgi:hypothetical protein
MALAACFVILSRRNRIEAASRFLKKYSDSFKKATNLYFLEVYASSLEFLTFV